ncbi:MAG: cbb3-type cytochrome c oxidase subunit II [Chlamydiales bacterium]
MSDQLEKDRNPTKQAEGNFLHKLDASAVWTIIGIILLFSFAIIVTLIAPNYVDQSWISPTSSFQVQMYEIEDPNIYISNASSSGADLQYVHHLKQDFTLLAFKESANLRIISSVELEKFITHEEDPKLKLTSRLLLLRVPEGGMQEKAQALQTELQKKWLEQAQAKGKGKIEKIYFQVLELFDPHKSEAFSYNTSEGILQNWVDENYVLLDESVKQPYHSNYGVVFVQNPIEYRISFVKVGAEGRWVYNPKGTPVENLDQLKQKDLKYHSRKELIAYGEHIYAIEGCWYCHTDQTRTLIQDVVLNGSDSFPAPPSSPNEYIYQKITFAGTRRIGPDISRTGVKRPSRDWHMSHFWDPKTASAGSIMPSFRHFFDFDPRGTGKNTMGIPNQRFEAIYQYLMTKGTRITPPTQAWWLGKDPIRTKEIIEGQRILK